MDSTVRERLLHHLRDFGVLKTLSLCLSVIDDQYLRSFDRRYRVRTSDHIALADTSFDPSKLPHATSYGPVNAWAFRWLLKKLNLPKTLRFVDLGCGQGRACILAAEYGFARVTGVELAPELCATALENVSRCRLPVSRRQRVHIIQGDVLEYCDDTEDEVFFIYRPFSLEFLRIVREKLAESAAREKKPLTVIYSERLSWPPSCEVKAFSEDRAFRKVHEENMLGQAFYVYQCGALS